jgi:hypothetical protein
MLPVTFERNLAASRRCEYLGRFMSSDEAVGMGGNLVLLFRYTRSFIDIDGYHDSFTGDYQGKVMKCPTGVLAEVQKIK